MAKSIKCQDCGADKPTGFCEHRGKFLCEKCHSANPPWFPWWSGGKVKAS